MSEDMMQKFAVPDRELPILDIIDSDQTIASFVPRGLWLIGAWGRIDIITPNRTQFLVALRNENKTGFEWRLFSPDNRLQGTLFDRSALLQLVALP